MGLVTVERSLFHFLARRFLALVHYVIAQIVVHQVAHCKYLSASNI